MPLISQIVGDYCKAKGITQHADTLEKDVRFARDMWPSAPANKTVQGLVVQFFKAKDKHYG